MATQNLIPPGQEQIQKDDKVNQKLEMEKTTK